MSKGHNCIFILQYRNKDEQQVFHHLKIIYITLKVTDLLQQHMISKLQKNIRRNAQHA